MVQRDARPPFAAIGGAVSPEFAALPTPCYLLDEAALTCNAEILGNLSRRTGCRVLLAQKAFSNYDLYPLLAPHLAGTEASGLFEARLGAEEMPGKEVHVFCAAYRADEMEELLQYADHIVFNSPAQLAKFGPAAKAAGKSVGLRINPECSTQDGHAIYDPCAPGSRLGTTRAQWDAAVAADPALPALLDGLHFHTLCEQDADALAVTLDAAADKFGDLLSKMQWLNLGGGHHITRPGYNMTTLEHCIRRAHQDWGVTVYLEPGEACALNAGYLLTRVLDVVQNGDTTIAILDTSAACHMPDVIEMPYRPPLLGAGEPGEKACTVRLALPLKGGNTVHLLRAESSGPSVSKIMPKVQTSASILYLIYIGLTALEAVLLKLGGMTLFDSLNYAMSTAATGGFGVYNEGIGVYNSDFINIVVTVFMFLFGLNFNVYFLLLAGKPKEILKKSEIKVYFLLIFISILTIGFFVREYYDNIKDCVVNTAFTVGAFMTSTGFALTDFDVWPLYPKVILTLLMIIGACAGSTCGSMKISRVIILIKASYANLRRLVSPRSIKSIKMDGKRIESETIADVNAFVTIYILIMIVSVILVSLDGQSITTTGSAVAATMNNIGIGFQGVGYSGNFSIFSSLSKLVMCFDMIAGRLEIFPLIILLMPRTWRRH